MALSLLVQFLAIFSQIWVFFNSLLKQSELLHDQIAHANKHTYSKK